MSRLTPSLPHSRPPLARMMRLHEMLQTSQPISSDHLAHRLEVSGKTILRDLAFMRDQLGLPVSYDATRHGFRYTEAVASFPTLRMSEGELVALLFAQQALAQYHGAPFESSLRRVVAKLSAELRDVITVSPGDVAPSFSFRTRGPGKTDLKLFSQLGDAIAARRRIGFRYRKIWDDSPRPRQVEPYHLACVDGLWYLIGRDVDKNAMRTFALPRISALIAHTVHFTRSADFTPERYFGRSFGIHTGEGHHSVRLRFDRIAAGYIRERFWHTSQTIEEKPGGELELTLRLGSLDEIARWVLSWEGRAVVKAPPELRARIREAAATVKSRHG